MKIDASPDPSDTTAGAGRALEALDQALIDAAGDAAGTLSFAGRGLAPADPGAAQRAVLTLPRLRPVTPAGESALAPAAPFWTALPRPDAASDGSLSFEGSTIAPRPPDSERSTARRGLDFGGTPREGAEYMLQRRIGEGGMGEVWQAWQAALDRTVAVKRLKKGDPVEFLQEAFISAELEHPNIVPVHDLGRVTLDDGSETPLLAMKLVEGSLWSRLLAEERGTGASWEDYLIRHLRILIDVCQAVAFAHARSIIHRDLKPAQVMVGAFGEVYLMDWGLAMSLREEVVPSTATGLSKYPSRPNASNQCGSPAYMAPEQMDEGVARVGFHTDVYLLGAILYEVLAGRPPHHAPTARQALLRAILNDVPPLPEDTPPELRALADAALATDPAQRPASAAAFRDALEDFLSGAGRRRESAQVAAEVAARLDAPGGAAALDYAALALLRQRTHRALQLWPESPEARRLDRDLLIRHTRLALAERDLKLAESLAASLPAEDPEAPALRRDAAEARTRQARRERERRLLAAATLLLLVASLAFGLAARDGRLRAASEAAERRAAVAERGLAEQRALETARLADLLRDIDDLRSEEARLAGEFLASYDLPDTLDTLEFRRVRHADDPAAREHALALLERRRGLAHRRDELASRLPADVRLADLPAGLALGEALVGLVLDADEEQAARTRSLFEELAAAAPDDPEPRVGAAIALYLGGFPTSASLALREAADLAALHRGEDAPLRADALAMAGDVWRRLDLDSSNYLEAYRDSLAVLEPRWLEMTATIGDRKTEIGLVDEGLALTSAALALMEGRDDLPPRTVARVLVTHALGLQLRMEHAASLPLFTRASAITAEVLRDAPAGQERLRALSHHVLAVTGLADAERLLGDYKGAIRRLEQEAMPLIAEVPALRDQVVLTLANAAQNDADYERALTLHLELREARRARVGDENPATALATLAVGQSLIRLGRWQEARAECEAAIAVLTERFGPDHPHSLGALTDLAQNLFLLGRLDEALQVHATLDERLRGSIWRDSFLGVVAQNNHAMMLIQAGRNDEAVAQFAGVLRAIRALFGDMHPHTATVLKNMSDVALVRGDTRGAWRALMASQRIIRGTVGEAHTDWFYHLMAVSQLLGVERRGAEAVVLAREALAAGTRIFGDDNPRLAGVRPLMLLGLAASDPADPRAELRTMLAIQAIERGDPNIAPTIAAASLRLGQLAFQRGVARRALALGGDFLPMGRRALLQEAAIVELLGLPAGAAERDGWIDEVAAPLGLAGDVARARDVAAARASTLWAGGQRLAVRADLEAILAEVAGESVTPPFDDLASFAMAELLPPDPEASRAAAAAILEELAAREDVGSLDEFVGAIP